MNLSPKIDRALAYLVAACVIIGIGLRWFGQMSDLWLDEIWLLRDVRSYSSVLDYFSLGFTQGQPSLYTVLVYLLQSVEPEWIIRVPSFLFSVGSIALAFGLSRRHQIGDKLLAPIFFSINFVLVLYGSEARGYSALIFFSLAALLTLLEGLKSFQLRWLVLFWVASALGFLFHPTFLQFYLGLGIYSLHQLYSSDKFSKGLVKAVGWHYLPVVFVWLWSVKFLIQLPGLNGPRPPYLDTIASAISVSFGGPEISPVDPGQSLIAYGVTLFVTLLFCAELFLYLISAKRKWSLYLGSIFIGPGLMLAVVKPEVLLPRYFVGSLAPALLLFSELCARQLSSSAAQRVFGGVLLAFYLFGQAALLSEFGRYGRGQYSLGLEYISAHTKGSEITVSSNQDFRNRMLVEYYGPKVTLSKHFRYVPQERKDGAEWFLFHIQDKGFVPPTELEPGFELVAQYNCAALSGWRWFVYHKRDLTL